MRYSSERSFRRQFDFLRRQFLQDGELPFTDRNIDRELQRSISVDRFGALFSKSRTRLGGNRGEVLNSLRRHNRSGEADRLRGGRIHRSHEASMHLDVSSTVA